MATIVAISSHVARGHVGNSAAVIALQSLGHEVWAVPTVLLAHHPGHGPVTALRTPADGLATLLRELAGDGRLAGVDAVASGYLALAEQAGPVAQFVKAVKAANPRALYCCDPILGDDDALYVAPDVAQAVRDILVPLADILTPNRFELGWLGGAACAGNTRIMAAARGLGAARVLVTSSEAMMRDSVATLLATKTAAWLAETRRLPNPPHGAGDLMAALFLGHLLNGAADDKALEAAAAGVFRVLVLTAKAARDELDLVAARNELARPRALVHLRRLAEPREAAGGR